MSISTKVKEYLDREHVGYQILQHSLAYTAMEIAGAQHVPGKQLIKSVIVKADGNFFMCVLPAIHLIDFDKLKKITGAKDIQLAKEREISELFPDYEMGAEPPFGQLYSLRVFVDKMLEENEEIVFNAGTHTDMIKIKFKDFIRLTKPTIADFGTHI
jgi:Ala-tRNA(Pro) deacylase